MLQSAGSVELTTQRGRFTLALNDSTTPITVLESLVPFLPPVIDTVFPNDRAMAGGLREGDSVMSVGGAPVRSWSDIVDRVSPSAERTIDFVVHRSAATDATHHAERHGNGFGDVALEDGGQDRRGREEARCTCRR